VVLADALVAKAFVLAQGEDLPEAWRRYFIGPEDDAYGVLASALARRGTLGDRERAAFVIREEPEPALVLVGLFYMREAAQVRALQRDLLEALTRFRYVSYRQAEEDCERLTARLVDTLGRDALARCSFVGIPRGGLLVLGMLSYALGLRPDQLYAAPEPGRLRVVVDDCALTGYRFGRFMSDLDGPTGGAERGDVVFAHLYSSESVRDRIEREVPRVLACCAARDLEERRGGADMPWRGRRYGRGPAAPLAFAWSEPSRVVRDEGGALIPGWRLVPPAYCLSERSAPALPIQRQPTPPDGAALYPAPQVVYARLGSEVVVADLSTGEGFALEGTAAVLWRAIAAKGTLEGAVSALREAYAADELRLRHDARTFADQLVAAGLLRQRRVAEGRSDGA
jgi:hypothetical protein